jgi:glycosyltransferase involved in cell wall biosynthesis
VVEDQQNQRIKVSMILPCFNEVGSIGYLTQQFIGLGWNEINSEIVIVDDGSTDGTLELLELLSLQTNSIKLVRPEKRLGLAASILLGIENSTGEFCLVMDSDGMHDPCYVAKFLAECDSGAKLVIGSRYVSGGIMLGGVYPTLSRGMNLLIKQITKSSVNDQLCGFFMAPRKLLSQIPSKNFEGFGEYFIRIINFFERENFKISEIPTIHRVRLSGKSTVRQNWI